MNETRSNKVQVARLRIDGVYRWKAWCRICNWGSHRYLSWGTTYDCAERHSRTAVHKQMTSLRTRMGHSIAITSAKARRAIQESMERRG
jgi:hypothetical protein